MNAKILKCMKAASGDKDEALKLDFYFDFWRLLKTSGVNPEDLEWIHVTSVDEAERAKLDYLSALWVKVKSKNTNLESTEGNIVKEIIDEIGSGILSQTIERKQDLWKRKRKRVLEEVKNELAKCKVSKTKFFGASKEAYTKDVDEIQAKFGLKHSLLLAQLQNFEAYYSSPSTHLQVLWHVLTYDFEQQTQECPVSQELEPPINHTPGEQQAGGTIEPSNSSKIQSPQDEVQQKEKRKRTTEDSEDYSPHTKAKRASCVQQRPVNDVFRALSPNEMGITYAWNTNSAVSFLTQTVGQQSPMKRTESFDHYDISSALPAMLLSHANEMPFISWYKMIGMGREGASLCVKHATIALPLKNMKKPSYFHAEFIVCEE